MSGSSGRQEIETELKSFAFRDFRVDFDHAGELLGVEHRSQPGASYLRGLSIGDLCLIGQGGDAKPVPWTQCRTQIDADEVERTWTAERVAGVTLRHSFGGGWRTRIACTNLAATAWTGTLELRLEPGEAFRSWGVALARESTLAILPWSAELPVLAARSVSPPIGEAVSGALRLGPIVLAPGDRFVAAWDWWSTPHPGGLADRLSAHVPRRLTVELGEEIWLRADPDTAVVAPPDVEIVDDQHARALTAAEPGRRRVEVRSARGSTVLDLAWVLPPPDFLAATAERLLAEPPGPNGIVRLPDLPAALVVQRAARGAGLTVATEAADALDLFTARLLDTQDESAPALPVIFLSGEYDRTGDLDLLAEAARRLSTARTVTPGLGSATLRSSLASVATGDSPTVPAVRVDTAIGSSLAEAAAALELRLAVESPPRLLSDRRTRDLLYRLGIEVGAGLPGRASVDLSVEDLGHCLAVLHLTPESLFASWSAWFAVPLPEIVDVLALELTDRLAGEPVSLGHAWLALTC